MATDEQAYKLWTKAFSKVIKAQVELDKERRSVDISTPGSKLASVENIVEAAIQNRKV